MTYSDRRHQMDAPCAVVLAAGNAKPRQLRMHSDGQVPNNPDLPALILPGAVDAGLGPDTICALYEANGWRRVWTWRVFDYHHYHPNAHEVLTCATGWADIRLGGAGGTSVHVTPGDALLLPAGFGHCLENSGDGFQVCGGYPPDQADRVITTAGELAMSTALAQIALVTLPQADPIFGTDGPLLRAWRQAGDKKHDPHRH